MFRPDVAGNAAPLRKRLPIFFLVDVSGSMYGNRIAAVNEAMNKVVPKLVEFKNGYPLIDFAIRVITYGNGKAQWKVGDRNNGVPLEKYIWAEIYDNEIDGGTPADKAIELVMTTMGRDFREYLGAYVGTPLILIISDGESNGNKPFTQAVDELRNTPVGSRSIMVAIGIDTQNNPRATQELEYFGVNGFRHCSDDPEKIVELVQTATVKSLKVVSDKTNDEGNNKTTDVFEDSLF